MQAISTSAGSLQQESVEQTSAEWRKELDYLVISKVDSLKLNKSHQSKYYQFNKSLVPEAFDDFYPYYLRMHSKGGPIKGEAQVPVRSIPRPKAGCKGLQSEWIVSGTERIMHRECIQDLRNVLGNREGGVKLFVQGLQGSGKSIAMAALVEVMRAAGWLVMYVPHCTYMTEGGFYSKNPETGKWDTPIVAQSILRGMLTAYSPDFLSQFPCGNEQNMEQTLLDVCQRCVDSKSPSEICQLVERVRDEFMLMEQYQTAIVLDGYNALYYDTKKAKGCKPVRRPSRQRSTVAAIC
eukprot:TRINITY_DN9323_c1_g1_i4.p1 TRINITY_DN9323_c1_g1~~TRINITY_DN9323_c1_g1_i4.p1  ORF type:complete len:337 (-),score=23.55 TRINITY_DN9323_c1_g1_i4:27-908(-)